MKFFVATFGLEVILVFIVASLLGWGFRVKKPLLKHLGFNMSAVFIALLLYEFIATIINKPQSEVIYSEPYYEHDLDLGYSVRNSPFSIKATKRWVTSGKEIYSVDYSFAKGRRVTPHSDSNSRHYGIFLGGSFTFGEGVNDDETLPYYYNENATEKLNIRNYGFHGYGTHQVYTIVKNQIANDTVLKKAENVNVFYWFIDPHIFRANGYSKWDQKSPKYIVENGILKNSGTFKEATESRVFVEKFFDFTWSNSAIYQRIQPRLATGKEEVNLFLTLIKETDRILKKQGFKFTVLIHHMPQSDLLFGSHYRDVKEKIKLQLDEDIEVVFINELESNDENGTDMLFIPGDGHPTGEFNKRLATFLWKRSNSQSKIP